MATITVWPDCYVSGWNGEDSELEELEGFPPVPLWDALVQRYRTDAHCVCYCVPGEEAIPRINKRALFTCEREGLKLRFDAVFVDVDHPKTPPEGWRSRQVDKLQGSPFEACPPGPGGWYGTRGGLRLVYLLPEPLGPAGFEHYVSHLLLELDKLGVSADKACRDWTRCYRLPRVYRDGQDQDYRLVLPSVPLSWSPPKGAKLPRRLSGVQEPVRNVLADGTVIQEGGRNAALTRVAGSLRGRGLAEGALLAALRAENERICDPPLDDREVETIARSVARYEPEAVPQVQAGDQGPGEPPRVALGSENELADLVLRALEEGEEQTVHDRGVLWRYEPALGIWEEVPEHATQRLLEVYDGAPYGQSSRVRVSARMVKGVLNLIAGKRSRPGYFDHAPPGVPCSNGRAVVCDCPDGCEECQGSGVVLLDHSPEARATFALPVPYDPSVPTPRWDRFLLEVFEGVPDAAQRRALLQEFTGSCLIGYATRLQRACLLVGEGANGKSTFLDVVSALFPDEARASVPPQHMDNDYRRDLLAKARINIVSEVPESEIASAEAFRAIVDGSEITARCIYQRPYRFRPQAGHLLACNSLPGVKDFSHAFWRRWLAIAFERVFDPEDQEPGLSQRLIREELVGVVAWALSGAVRVKRAEAYTVPASSVQVAERWRRQADQVAAFVDDELELSKDPAKWMKSTDLYQLYVRWAGRNGQRFTVSHRKLSERVCLLSLSGTRIAKLKRRDANYVSVAPRSQS